MSRAPLFSFGRTARALAVALVAASGCEGIVDGTAAHQQQIVAAILAAKARYVFERFELSRDRPMDADGDGAPWSCR